MQGQHKLTKSFLDKLLPKPGSPYVVYDTELPGFGVRVGATSKVYLVQKRVGGKVVKLTIGKHGPYTPDLARKAAQELLYQLSQGRDPLQEKRQERLRAELTFGKLLEQYLEERDLKPNTVKDYRTKVKRLLADWLPLPVNEITRSMARDRLSQLVEERPTQGALVARCARAVFNFGIEYYRDNRTGESQIKQNPIEAFTRGKNKKMPEPRRRDAYLSEARLPAWFAAVERVRSQHPIVADYLVVTLLLGARRTETARMEWGDVNLEQATLAFRDTKNKRDHHLPLPLHVLGILKRRREGGPAGETFVFPGNSRVGYLTEPRYVMGKIIGDTGVSFAMHDLRRTFATVADALDLNQRTIKRLMNHKDDPNDVTLGYIVNEVNRLRTPMQQIEDYILKAGRVKADGLVSLADCRSQANV